MLAHHFDHAASDPAFCKHSGQRLFDFRQSEELPILPQGFLLEQRFVNV